MTMSCGVGPVLVDVQASTLGTWADVATVVGGFSTLAAFAAAAAAAVWARQAAGSTKKQADASDELLVIKRARDVAAAKVADAALDAAQRAQACLVNIWVEYDRRRIVVRNASDQLIYDLRLFAKPMGRLAVEVLRRADHLLPAAAHVSPGEDDMRTFADRRDTYVRENEIYFYVADSDDEDDPMNEMAAAIDTRLNDDEAPEIRAPVQFRDANAKWWRQRMDGSLAPVPAPEGWMPRP